MKATIKLTLIVISVVVLSLTMFGLAMAATNEALDGGGGGILLGGSGTVTITSTQLGLVKAVFDQAGNCLASSDNDPACGVAPFNDTAVLTGTRLTFVIYVDNTTAITANDIRFIDDIDDNAGAGDYFQFVTDTYGAGQGLAFGTTGSGDTKANIRTAAMTGTPLTNALDGAAQLNEYAGIDTAASPDRLYVGGDNVSPDNDQVDVGNQVWAITFDVIKLD